MDDRIDIELTSDIDILKQDLDIERASFVPHWQDLTSYIGIRQARYISSDINRGDPRTKKILDTTASIAMRTLRAGMMSGMTSPSRPWKKLTHSDNDLYQNENVRRFMHESTTRMRRFFNRTNLYKILPMTYEGTAAYGTHAVFMEPVYEEERIHFYSIPIGSYWVATDPQGRVNVFLREIEMTIRQIKEKFGEDNIGLEVYNLAKEKNNDVRIVVTHVIRPNPNYDPDSDLSEKKKFQEVYYNSGHSVRGQVTSNANRTERAEHIFSISGYDLFPVLCPRWSVVDGDSYGTNCPGMLALPDVKQLQFQEMLIGKASGKQIDPPTVGPSALARDKLNTEPGGHTYLDVTSSPSALRALYEVQFRTDIMEARQDGLRTRIKRALHTDLFLYLTDSDRRERSATETSNAREEQLQILGPTIEQLNQDLLDPLIEFTFHHMFKMGLLPELPEELEGAELEVEYISTLALAQLSGHLRALDRFLIFIKEAIQFEPKIRHKPNWFEIVDEYAELTGIPPKLIKTNEEAQRLLEQEQEEMRRREELEQAQASAAVAKDEARALKDSPLPDEGLAVNPFEVAI